MLYQLVIQFSESFFLDVCWLAQIEDVLQVKLNNAEVDGHDIGSDEANIFILTDTPKETFDVIKKVLGKEPWFNSVEIAYRGIESEDYICQWPIGLVDFSV